MVIVGVVGNPGCTGSVVGIRPVAAAVTAAASPVRL